ncbi:fibronectin [bacterium]|nr:fibronectin [bacterium]
MNKLKNTSLLLLILLIMISPLITQAQVDNGLRKWIKVGSLQSFFDAYGAERAWNANAGIYEGLQWPAWYSEQDNFVIDRSFIACRNFTDAEDVYWDYKGLYFTASNNITEETAMSNILSAKFESPSVKVDGTLKLTDSYVDTLHDENLPFDRILTNKVRTCIGVDIIRKVYAFSQPYHDNYFIYEYTFKNSGNVDKDDDIELPDNVVEDFYYGNMPRYATSQEARWTTDGPISWGAHQWIHHTSQADNPEIPYFYTWLGKVENLASIYDNIGGPIRDYDIQKGRLSAPQFAGCAMLHASTSATDDTNDLSKFKVGWHDGDTYPKPWAGENKQVWEMLSGDNIFKNSGSYETPMYDGMTWNNIPQKVPSIGAGGAAGLYSVGPYTLNIGEEVTFVMVEAVAGLDRVSCINIGRKWLSDFNGISQAFILPDNSSGTDRNEYKNSWVYTGIDSILQTFQRAKANYESNYGLASAPPPPDFITIESLGDKIALSWSPNAETYVNFGGYRIYRAVTASDSIYHEIFSCGINDAVNYYEDKTAIRGLSYYYYIVSLSDGSLNINSSINPVGQLESGRAYTQTVEPAYLRRQSGESMDGIRIVANPYSIGNIDWQYGTGDDRDRIYFLDVPGHCTIKIFTERGDLIKTISHESGSGDKEWNLDTESRQVLVSGVYIAYFEVTEDILDPFSGNTVLKKGDATYKKFVVIR